jgi:hypothetical protein
MPDFPVIANVDPVVISAATPQSIGEMMNAIGQSLTAAAWSSANRAYYIPVSIFSTITVVKMMVINGGTVSGNIDVGIYDAGGARLVSSGSTAQSGTSAIQEFNITDTVLNPGLYYLACAMDNTTGTVEVWNPSAAILHAFGICEQASAFALPSSATFGAITGTTRIPFIGATLRTVV